MNYDISQQRARVAMYVISMNIDSVILLYWSSVDL